jgi:hypothetical protein
MFKSKKIRYNGCKFMFAENASPLFYIYSYEQSGLEVRDVFRETVKYTALCELHCGYMEFVFPLTAQMCLVVLPLCYDNR